MKKALSFALLACLYGQLTFAGSSTFYKNEPLGFTLQVAPMSDTISFCDQKNHCLEFNPVGSSSGAISTYKELSGKCVLTLESFEKNFAQGKTKNDFMLSIMGQVVSVISGEDQCQLDQTEMIQKRSLTGIYL